VITRILKMERLVASDASTVGTLEKNHIREKTESLDNRMFGQWIN